MPCTRRFRSILAAALLLPAAQAQEELEQGGRPEARQATSFLWEVHADEVNEQRFRALPAGKPLLTEALAKLKVSPPDAGDFQAEVVPTAGQPFDKALRLGKKARTKQGAAKPLLWLETVNEAPIANKEMGLVTFWARTASPAASAEEEEEEEERARLQFICQMNVPQEVGSYLRDFEIGPRWQKFYFPFRFKIKRHGAAGAIVQAGEQAVRWGVQMREGQAVELADIRWMLYPRSLAFARMPITSASYAGREADAAWRREAAQRIERHRKADLTVTVTDAGGRPVTGAKVDVRMIRSSFPWGTAVSASSIRGSGADHERYRTELKRNFRRLVFEGETKWPGWVDPERRAEALKCLDWAEENGLEFRGHVLVYPKWRKNQPSLKKQYAGDPEGLKRAIGEYITDIAGTLKGRITDWDVINEYTSPEDWVKLLGKPVMVEWFKQARAADPNAGLVFNDNSIAIASGGSIEGPRQRKYYETIRYLKDQGAPIDAMGLQYRAFWHRLSPPESVLKVFGILNQFDLDIHITEFDLLFEDEQLQADLLRDYMTIAFSQPRVRSFLMWGFWDGRHHRNNALLYREDWSLKPSGQAFRDLVFGRWQTEESGRTDASGKFATRGFLGGYEITAAAGGRIARKSVELTAGGLTTTLEL